MRLNLNELMVECIRNRDQLPEPTIGLRKLLNVEGTEGYIKLCVKRMSDAGIIDGKSIDIDLSDPFNLLMTYQGMRSAYEILKGYCNDVSLERYVYSLRKTSECFNQLNHQVGCYRLLSRKELRSLARKEGIDMSSSDDAIERVSVLAAEELKSRKLHNRVMRKFVKIADEFRVLWEHRRVLALIAKAQHIGN